MGRGTVALALSVVLLVAMAGPTSAAGPTVLYAHVDTQIDVNAIDGVHHIISLPVGAGNWFAVAKTEVRGPWVQCELVAGADEDVAVHDTDEGQLSLAVVHHFDADGTVDLYCYGADVGGWVDWARITAVQVATLKNQAVPGGAVTTDGTGSPLARAAFHDANVQVGSTLSTVASMSLGQGRWWVFAKLQANLASARQEFNAGQLDCRLRLEDSAGSTSDRAFEVLWKGQTTALGLQQVRTIGSGGAARVRCSTSLGTSGGDMEISMIKIVALRLGTLVKGTLGGSFTTTGSGDPLVIFGSKAGPVTVPATGTNTTMASLSLPAGEWAITATAWVEDPVDLDVGSSLICRLVTPASVDVDQVGTLTLSQDLPQAKGIVLATVHAFTATGFARLRCKTTVSQALVHDIRISALSTGAFPPG
jgi:hypothetical protein